MTTKQVAKAAQDVYRGYMPIDLPQHRPRNRFKHWWKVLGKPRVTLYPKTEIEGFSEEPEYPPLNDGTKKGVRGQIRLDWYEKLKAIPTVDGKLHEFGRHTTHFIAHIHNWLPRYNSLPMAQYLTRTAFVESLPDKYKNTVTSEDRQANELLDRMRSIVLEQIAIDKFESFKKGPKFVSKIIRDRNQKAYISNQFIQNLVNSVKRSMVLEANPDLLDYQVDLSPAIRSWWYHSGFEPPNNKVFFRSRKDDDGRINQLVQMDGSSALNFRSDNLLKPIISQSDSLVTDTSLIRDYCHPLKAFGAAYKFKWPVALPGFWYEKEPRFDCPHTCFLSTDCLHLRNRPNYKRAQPFDDQDNSLNTQAMMTAFGWLNSLSMYHGYTPFQELHYPLTCQVVTTDGQNWLFNVYQLNSHTFHRDLGGPKKNNVCWSSGLLKLYDDYVDGEFTGVNDEVVRLLIQFMSQKTSPSYTSQLNLRPYLGKDTRTDEEKNYTRRVLRLFYEQKTNNKLKHDWKVPLFEHLFFRSPAGRNRITHMKPKWHIPKLKPPKIFE